MSVTVKDVMQVMNTFASLKLAEVWDNCGLLVGDASQIVNKIYIALDPTMAVIDEAIRVQADMLLTHHPLTLDKMNQINTATLEGRKFIKLIRHDIALYCAHTNLDQKLGGLNDFLADKIGLKDYQVLEITGHDEKGRAFGLGCYGELEHTTDLNAMAHHVKSVLGLEYIQIVGDPRQKIKRVAVCSGSGMSALEFAISVEADVFITSDIKYHGAIEAIEKGICLIDGTHFGTENIVSELLGKVISGELPELEIVFDNLSQHPIKFIK